MYTVSMSYFTFLRNHFSEKSNMDAVFAAFVVYVLFTFLRNHFSEKSNMDAASAAFGVKCPFTHY